MAIQNSETPVAKGASIKTLKTRAPEWFEKLEKEKPAPRRLSDDETAFIDHAMENGYGVAAISRCIGRSHSMISNYMNKKRES